MSKRRATVVRGLAGGVKWTAVGLTPYRVVLGVFPTVDEARKVARRWLEGDGTAETPTEG